MMSDADSYNLSTPNDNNVPGTSQYEFSWLGLRTPRVYVSSSLISIHSVHAVGTVPTHLSQHLQVRPCTPKPSGSGALA